MIKLPVEGRAYFASDLHLCQETPKTLAAFEAWLDAIAQENTLIFLLGDVFEVWFGDDYTDSVTERFAAATRKAHESGSTVYMTHGNRDFLMANQFSQYAHIELLNDPEYLQVGKHTILLSHGDRLCTDDHAYQQFRQTSRSEVWQQQFLRLPLEHRIELATQMRAESKMHKANAILEIMDVNPEAISNVFEGLWPDGERLTASQVIIHGHTHRCAVHTEHGSTQAVSQQGSLSQNMRIVLPDWTDDSSDNNACRGGFLLLHPSEQYELEVWN